MVKLAAVPRVLQRGEAEALLLSELATRERLLPQRERDPGLRSTLTALLRLHREWRATDPEEAEAKGLSVALTLLALGEAAGVSELERAADEFEAALYLSDFARFDEALQHYEKSLAIQLKQLGPEHPDVAATYNNMGNVFAKQGRYAEALQHHEKSLAIRLKQLGPEHPDVADTYNNMAIVFDSQGRYAEALQHHEKSLAIKLKQLGPEHPSVADTRYNLALLHKAQGRRAEARVEFERAAAIYARVHGPEHSETLDARREAAEC